ncbi:hypothetical protein KCP74_11990 [Salmonella enterica subsp. enterica]|nr:hypothetical protein KCP74_11990 [Salmonella enterica subsp. enterica]
MIAPELVFYRTISGSARRFRPDEKYRRILRSRSINCLKWRAAYRRAAMRIIWFRPKKRNTPNEGGIIQIRSAR